MHIFLQTNSIIIVTTIILHHHCTSTNRVEFLRQEAIYERAHIRIESVHTSSGITEGNIKGTPEIIDNSQHKIGTFCM